MNVTQLPKPMKDPPRLANGERLVSLDAAAFFLRISRGTIQARLGDKPGDRGPGAARHLTPQQFASMAADVSRLRSGSMWPLDEAARYLEMPERAVMGHVAAGKLRECAPRAAFFGKRELDFFLVRVQGIADPISLYRADKLVRGRVGQAEYWVRTRFLKGVRAGRTTFVSKAAVEAEDRRRKRLQRRLRVLREAGRLFTIPEAAAFLGICSTLIFRYRDRGMLKSFKSTRVDCQFFRLRDLERLKALNLVNLKRPPGELLSAEAVAKALGVSKGAVTRFVKKGHLRLAARIGSRKHATMGFDLREVERLKAERSRLNELVGAKEACEILQLRPWTLGKLVRQGLLVPRVRNSRTESLYDPKELRGMRNAPFLVEARWRASTRGWSRRRKSG